MATAAVIHSANERSSLALEQAQLHKTEQRNAFYGFLDKIGASSFIGKLMGRDVTRQQLSREEVSQGGAALLDYVAGKEGPSLDVMQEVDNLPRTSIDTYIDEYLNKFKEYEKNGYENVDATELQQNALMLLMLLMRRYGHQDSVMKDYIEYKASAQAEKAKKIQLDWVQFGLQGLSAVMFFVSAGASLTLAGGVFASTMSAITQKATNALATGMQSAAHGTKTLGDTKGQMNQAKAQFEHQEQQRLERQSQERQSTKQQEEERLKSLLQEAQAARKAREDLMTSIMQAAIG